MKAGHDVTVLEASGGMAGTCLRGRDGFSDGLYADYARTISGSGYEKFL